MPCCVRRATLGTPLPVAWCVSSDAACSDRAEEAHGQAFSARVATVRMLGFVALKPASLSAGIRLRKGKP